MYSCKITRFLICVVVCGWFFVGCKDDKLEIPKQLAGSTWRGWMIEGPTYELTFAESDCILTTITTTEDGKEDVTVKSYLYTYDMPNLLFVSKEDETDKLYGELITNGASYLLLSLHTKDYSMVADLNRVNK
jgi:hypothetical protein